MASSDRVDSRLLQPPRRPSRPSVAYRPERGLTQIALAETAEKYFRRAKDASRLLEAVEVKLSEQRKFILWWDGQGFNRPGSPILSDRKGMKAGADGTPNSIMLHRWRTRLTADDAYEAALTQAQARSLRVCEFAKGQTEQRGASGTNENEWFTPAEYIEATRDVLGEIDLDPATHPLAQTTIQAMQFFTRAEDGLAQPWVGRVWLNPPYMQPDIARFVEKLVTEYQAGRTTAAILLTHNYTDTAWFHQAAHAAAALCFTRGRIRFVSPEGEEAAPTQGQAFFYYGADIARFMQRFRDIGFLVTPWNTLHVIHGT
jgi:phage N-6-adenine-methyltransferase